MDLQHLLDILFGLLCSVGGFVMKSQHAKIEDTTKRLAQFEVEAAKEFASKEDIREMKEDVKYIKNFLLEQRSK